VCLPTPFDVRRIALETGEDPYDFVEFLSPEEIEDVPKSDPTWLECDDDRYLMALRRHEKPGKRRHNGCYFLDQKTKKCSIYEARPILCRLFPFKLHETRDGDFKAFTLHKDIACPKDTQGTMATAPLYELYKDDAEHQEDYEALVEVFNRRPHERPQEFIRTFWK